MAITSNTYTANGTNKLFSITFPYLVTSDINVYLNGVLQTITTQYTFANATTVEFVTAPANGAVVLLDRDTDDTNLEATFFPGSSIKAADLNNNFDQTLYVVQEINNNAVKLDDPLYGNKTYIDAADATKVSKSGDTMSGNLAMGGNKITGLGTTSNATDAATKTYVDDNAVIYSGSPTFIQDGVGAISRSWNSKLKEDVSVKDFGAVGDGVTNDTAAIQAALDYAESLISGEPAYGQPTVTVFIPSGKYVVNATLTIQQNGVSLRGEGQGSYIFATNSSADVIKIGSANAYNGTVLRGNSIRDIYIGGFGQPNPASGAGIYADLTADTYIDNVTIIGKRQGIVLSGSYQGCSITNCNFSSGNTFTTFAAKSAAIAITQKEVVSGFANSVQDPDNSLWYVEPNSIHISNVNIQLGSNYDNSIYIESVDGLYVTNSYLGFSGGACIGYEAQHKIVGAVSVFVNNCFLDTSGPVSSIKISRAAGKTPFAEGWHINNCMISGFGNASITKLIDVQAGFSSNFKDLAINNCTIVNCNGNAVYLSEVHDIRITGCSFSNNATSSIALINCSNAVITGNRIKGGLNGITTSGSCPGLLITDNVFDAITNEPIDLLDNSRLSVINSNIETTSPQSTTVASATTINLPPEYDYFLISGTTNITTINVTTSPYRSVWIGRIVHLEFLGNCTVEHGTGNIRLATIANRVNAARCVLTLRYNVTTDSWVEVNWTGTQETNLLSGSFEPKSVTAPSYGMYLPAAGVLGFATNSVQTARLSANFWQASNVGLYVTLNCHQFVTNANETDVILRADNATYTNTVEVSRTIRTASNAYNFYSAQSNDGGDVEFRLRGDGEGFADGAWTGGGADYAEYFEWSDSNPDEEDRRGISVVLDGDKIREAQIGEDPIGVISGNPSVVGDSAWNKWSGKYLRDEYGTYILEDYEVEDEEGNVVVQQRRKLNTEYDPSVEYIPREKRPEWSCVGLMGKLRIRKGQVTGTNWVKMRDINNTVEEWFVK